MMAVARQPEFPHVELTRMRRRHLRSILKIEARVYPRPWSGSLFLSEMAQKSTRSYIVAKYNNEVVGYAGMMFTGPESHVTNIAVDPDFHSAKIGSRMLLHICTEAVARGADTISLEVRVSNDKAQAMYEKFGFGIVSIRRGYYIETNEDAYVMIVENARSTEFRRRLEAVRHELDELGLLDD
jgi:[ribosomal protein S18]-alanine N-acetyltransferase